MAEQNLNDAHVDVVLKQVRREGVPSLATIKVRIQRQSG
jgi:hypothetical protein